MSFITHHEQETIVTPRSEKSGCGGGGGGGTDGAVKIKTKASDRLSSSPKDSLGRGGDGLRGGEEQMVHISGWRFGCVNYKVSDREACQVGVPAAAAAAASVNRLPRPPFPAPVKAKANLSIWGRQGKGSGGGGRLNLFVPSVCGNCRFV